MIKLETRRTGKVRVAEELLNKILVNETFIKNFKVLHQIEGRENKWNVNYKTVTLVLESELFDELNAWEDIPFYEIIFKTYDYKNYEIEVNKETE